MNYKVGDLLRLNSRSDKESVCVIIKSINDDVFCVFWIQTAENTNVKNSSGWISWSRGVLDSEFVRLSP